MSREGPTLRDITVCMVNHDGERYLARSLDALARVRADWDQLLVIDNASSDGSVALVEGHATGARVVRLTANHGPGAARNAGLRVAGTRRVLFVDNDVLVTPGAIAALDGALDADPGAVAAVPRVLHAHDPKIVQYAGAGAHFLGLMTLVDAETERRDPGAPRACGSIVTACFLLDRARWGDETLMDERFFFHYEDHDLGLRARLRGHTLLVVPVAEVHHLEGTPGLSSRPGSDTSSRRVALLIRNRWLLLAKNYALRSLLVLGPCLAIFELWQIAGVARRRWWREWWGALVWIVGHTREILASRRRVQGTRRLPDRRLLEGGPLPLRAELARSSLERRAIALLDAVCASYWVMARRFL